jgi:hypothetical protein
LSPSFGWTSAELETAGGALTLAPGVCRAFDLGIIGRGVYGYKPPTPGEWAMKLALHGRLKIGDERDHLPHGRWVIRLTATAEDGPSSQYDVTIEWNAVAPDAKALLESVVVRAEEV